MTSRWTLGFDMSPHATAINPGIGSARLSAFVRGSATAALHNEEGHAWGEPREDAALPPDVWMLLGSLSTSDSETASHQATAGIRISVTTPWFSWSEEWELAGFAAGGTPGTGGPRTTAALEVISGKPRLPVTLTSCTGAGPGAIVPSWITSSVGSPAPPPADPTPRDIPGFARRVGQVVSDFFSICPIRITSSDSRAINQIRTTYLQERTRYTVPVGAGPGVPLLDHFPSAEIPPVPEGQRWFSGCGHTA